MSFNTGFAGASSAAILSELMALGSMEAYLVKAATISFFRFRYAKHTNFAMEPVVQQFNSVAFGQESKCLLGRTGDLITYCYLVAELPAISACDSGNIGGQCTNALTATGAYTGANQFPSLIQVGGGNGPSGGTVAQGAFYDYETTAGPVYSPAGPNCPNYVGQCTPGTQLYWNTSYDQNASVNPGSAILSDRNAWVFQNYGNRASSYNPDVFSEVGSTLMDNGNSVPWVHWHNAIGQKLVQRAALIIGNHVIDTLYSDFLYMWEELSGKAGKRLTEMIGKRTTRRRLIKDAGYKQRLWVPLPFSFTQHSGGALSIVTLQYHGVEIIVHFAPLAQCIVTSGTGVTPVRSDNYAPISDTDLRAHLDVTYIYLDMEERDKFASANYDALITQVQVAFSDYTSSNVEVSLDFNHPVIELIWAVRRKCMFAENNSFNYSGLDGRDPIESCLLLLNNQPRFQERPAAYFRLVQPYQHHSLIPDAQIYNYSFALQPESPQPTGSINFSRIDNAKLLMRLQPGLETEQVTAIVFARNHQILRFLEGVGGALFNM